MTFDQFLRGFALLCWLIGVIVFMLTAHWFAPHRSDADTQVYERCLDLRGVPMLDGWTGNVVGCQR